MVLGNKDEKSFGIHINTVKIKNSNKVDKNLTFKNTLLNFAEEHHTNFIIRKYLTIEETKLLASAFINSQFNYAPLIWMFENKSSIDKILKIHKRALEIVYDVHDESYENLLNRSDDN